MTPDGKVLAPARIVRAEVFAVSARSVIYRAALMFESSIDRGAGGYQFPNGASGPSAESGSPYPDPMKRSPQST